MTKRLSLENQEEALLLFGPHDRNIKELERRFGVQIFLRPSPEALGAGVTLAIRGKPKTVEQALSTLAEMRHRAVRERKREGAAPLELPDHGLPAAHGGSDAVYVGITGRPIRPLSPQQREYVQAIENHDLTFSIGPAGTGKTYLAVAAACAALQRAQVARIVLTRPVVEAGEKLGFLPGDFYEKVHPYLKPLYDAFWNMVGPDRFRALRDEEVIEIIPLAYMRGRTLEDAFVILDEAQNTTPEQMKMFLTRMGMGSRLVVTGDVTQIDLDRKSVSGLVHIAQVLKGVSGVAFVQFTEEDVVRHALVKKIIRAYNDWDKEREPGPPAPRNGGQ